MRFKQLTSAAISTSLLSSCAFAQSVNIDFGAEAGSPPSSYAGAGLPGVWNVIHQPWKFPPADLFGPFHLVDLQGNPTNASFSGTNTLGTFLNDPGAPSGDDATLMQDGLIGISPDIAQNFTISGLENGVYRFITYTWYWPSEVYGMVVLVKGSGVAQPVNGPWQGQHRLPVTYMMHVVHVTDGTIDFDVVGAGPGSFFNGNNFFQGLQLWKFPDTPCIGDIAPAGGNGAVNVDDLLLVINNWGPCFGCAADINVSGAVNVDDLLAVINHWGRCTGSVENCGKSTSGDCYAAHEGVGCSEPACCEAICQMDPFCCALQWDHLCADLANIAEPCINGVHPNCGNNSAGDCFSTSIPIVPGCSHSDCCAIVCQLDPFCCTFGWDSTCVEQALSTCNSGNP